MTRDKNSLWLGMQSSSEGSGSLKVRPGAAIWKQRFLEQCEAAAAATRIFKAHNLGLLQNSWKQYFRIPIYWQSSVDFISHTQKVTNFSSEKYPEFTLSRLFLVELWWFGFHTNQEVLKFQGLLQQTNSRHAWQYFCLRFALGKQFLPSCLW